MSRLWLNAGRLLALDEGGQVRSCHLLRHFAARPDVTYVSFDNQSELDRFAHEVVRLIRNTPAPGALRRAARALVEERYDWSVVAQDLEGALTRLVKPPHETHILASPDRGGAKRESAPAALREA